MPSEEEKYTLRKIEIEGIVMPENGVVFVLNMLTAPLNFRTAYAEFTHHPCPIQITFKKNSKKNSYKLFTVFSIVDIHENITLCMLNPMTLTKKSLRNCSNCYLV